MVSRRLHHSALRVSARFRRDRGSLWRRQGVSLVNARIPGRFGGLRGRRHRRDPDRRAHRAGGRRKLRGTDDACDPDQGDTRSPPALDNDRSVGRRRGYRNRLRTLAERTDYRIRRLALALPDQRSHLCVRAAGDADIANIPADQPRRFNPISQLLLCVFLTCIASVLIEGRRLGWSSVSTLAMAGIAVLSMAALWQVERRSAEPTIPPALARNRSYLLIVCAGSFYQFASYGSLLVLALFLQVRHGLRADHAGYIMSICCVAWLLGNVLAVKVTPDNRRQAILAMAAVGCVGAVGTAALSLTEKIVPAMVPTSLIGVASGVLASSLSAAAMHVSPHTVSGVGSAVLNTSRQSGMVIAIALLGGLSFDHQLLVPMLLVASAFAMVLVTTALAFRPNLFKQSSAQRLQSSACQFPSRG